MIGVYLLSGRGGGLAADLTHTLVQELSEADLPLYVFQFFHILGACMTAKSSIHLFERLSASLGYHEINERDTQEEPACKE
jgi:hypothetical protein